MLKLHFLLPEPFFRLLEEDSAWNRVRSLLSISGRKNVLRKLLRIPYRRLKAGFSVCWLTGWLCLFVAEVLSEMHEVRTFAPCKAFLFDMFAFFSSLENYLGFRTINVKGKTDHSVSLKWNKRFWTFLKRRVFFWLCIRLIYEFISPGWIKPACILLLVVTVTFFTRPDLLPLQNQLYLCLQSKNHIAVITHQSEQTCALIKLSRKLEGQQTYSR